MTTRQIKQNRSVATDHREETVLRQRRPYALLGALAWMILILLAFPARAVLLQGQVELLPGLNLVGIPLDPAQTPTVSSLLLRLGDSTTIAAVWRLDPASGLLQRCGYDTGGQPSGEGCAASVSPGEGWLVEAHAAATLPYTVNQPCPGVTLQPGLNLVAFPCVTAVTSYTLLPLLGDAVVLASVQGLDPVTGRWLTTTYYENQPAGAQFPILPGQAYLVNARSVSALADADFDGLLIAQETDLGTDPANPDSDGDGLPDGAEVNTYQTNPLVADSDGDTFKDGEEVAANTDPKNNTDTPAGRIPPDPATVAPAIDPTVATTVFAATQFLYSGSSPIQTGVAPGTIEAKQVAVLRGRITDRDGRALPGVAITVLNHPEFGQTLTRADGMFDLAVNGGGYLTVVYRRNNYLPVQRQVNVPWQDYVPLPEVILIGQDTQVAAIDLNKTTIQAARGSVVTDQDGTRQATLLIPPGTQAEIYRSDGTRQTVSTLHIRATEYTVGENGPKAMPAELPPTSAYTYAVELSAEEATVKIGGKDVIFNQPVPFYVENFLNLPIGIKVPVGYYDKDKSAWIPANDGQIIKILNITNESAELDTDGDGNVDNGVALSITEVERQQLAHLYKAGQSLWRVPLEHLSTYDCNYGSGPPVGGNRPSLKSVIKEEKQDDPKCVAGSQIECQNQILQETVGITGTPFSLHYTSDRVAGSEADRTLRITLSGSRVPSVLKRIELEIEIASRIFKQSFAASPNQSYTFVWDRLDSYGRILQGQQYVSVRIGYVYDGYYYMSPGMPSSFGFASGIPIPGNIPTRQEVILWQISKTTFGNWDLRQQGLGGWSIDTHHTYDLGGRVVYFGTGERLSPNNLSLKRVVNTIAQIPYSDDVAVGPDGSFYVADYRGILKVNSSGAITTIAGNGTAGYGGDGGLATQAELLPGKMAFAPDGSLYVVNVSLSEMRSDTVRRIDPNGIITTVAGGGDPENGFGEGRPATQVWFGSLGGIALGPDGSLYIADESFGLVRKVGPDGIITTVAGGGNPEDYIGDGGPATQAHLFYPTDVALGYDGSLYITDVIYNGTSRVRRVNPDGIITTVAGGYNSANDLGDGGYALEAKIDPPYAITIGSDGSLYILSYDFDYPYDGDRIRHITPDNIINTIAGGGYLSLLNGGSPATQIRLNSTSIAMDLEDNLYIADESGILQVSSAIPSWSNSEFAITSGDGSEIYIFSNKGKHLRTLNSLTGAILYQFGYDSSGRLTTITDANGNITTIEHDGSGNPTAIIALFGQRTELTVDANGYLASVTNPAGESYRMNYTAGGLLTRFTDPKGNVSEMSYDNLGRLQTDANAAGGSQTLIRTELVNGFEVALTTALKRTTTYRVEDLTTGDQRQTIQPPDGAETQLLLSTDGSNKVTKADGTVTESLDGPDPRFGMQAPVTKNLKTTTGGITSTLTSDVQATLTNPSDPLSLTQLTRTAILNGRTTTSVYTAANRKTTLTSAAGRQSYAVIDAQGRIVESAASGIEPIRFSYDNRGLLSSIRQGSGAAERVTSYTYDARGNLASTTDPVGNVLGFAHDQVGRVLTQTLANGDVIGFDYDANGNMTTLTPPGRPAHTFTYTPVDQLASYMPPTVGASATSTTYDYNADRQATQTTRPDGGILSRTYDSAGRLSNLTIPIGQYGYAYDSVSRLSSITAPSGVGIGYSYNGSLLTGLTWTGAVTGSVGFSYNTDFRLSQVTVNSSNPISYQYDADSLLIQVGDLVFNRSAQNGLLTGSTLSKVSDSLSYNGFGEVTDYMASYDNNSLLEIDYTYDKTGRITRKVETIDGAQTTYDYLYNNISQLEKVKKNGVEVAGYQYDANGNRLSKTTSGGPINGSYDDQDRLLSYGDATYTYTANGELQTKTVGNEVTTYHYDALGNLRSVELPNGDRIEYVIDGQNRRIGKKVDGNLVQGFLWQDQLKPIAELDGSSSLVSQFVYATRVNVPDYMIRGGKTYRLITDHLGSPRLVVNVLTGAVAQRIDYDGFGDVVLDTNPGFQPFGFAGGLYDRDTKLLQFGARDYDAQTGRWTIKDLIGFDGGVSNLYSYVSNNSVNSFDPYGSFDMGAWLGQITQYGNWTGARVSGGRRDIKEGEIGPLNVPGIDCIDECSKQHDIDYYNHGITGKNREKGECKKLAKQFDNKLIGCMIIECPRKSVTLKKFRSDLRTMMDQAKALIDQAQRKSNEIMQKSKNKLGESSTAR